MCLCVVVLSILDTTPRPFGIVGTSTRRIRQPGSHRSEANTGVFFFTLPTAVLAFFFLSRERSQHIQFHMCHFCLPYGPPITAVVDKKFLTCVTVKFVLSLFQEVLRVRPNEVISELSNHTWAQNLLHVQVLMYLRRRSGVPSISHRFYSMRSQAHLSQLLLLAREVCDGTSYSSHK